jgi:drug/metabolite transporter (DMT)-like permease
MNSKFWSTHAGAWTALMLLVMMWGSAFALNTIAARDISPFWITAGRLWIGAAFVYAVLRWRGETLPMPSTAPLAWRSYTIIGIFGAALPFFLYAWAASHAPSALLGITNGASPIITGLLVAWFVQGEVMTRAKWIGIGLGFAGLLALVGPEAWAALEGVAMSGPLLLGLMAGIAGAFCYASANIITRRAAEMSASAAATIFCLTGAFVCTGLALALEPLPRGANAAAYLSVLALGLFPSGVASIMYVWIIRTHGAVYASLATYIMPLWAAAIGVLFLDERLDLNAIMALLLIIGGVAVASRR